MKSQIVSISLVLSLVALATSAPALSSRATVNRINFTFYQHVNHTGILENVSLDGNETACINLEGSIDNFYTSLNVTNPTTTCLVLFDKKECRGKREFVFQTIPEFKNLNDQVSAYRLCDPERDGSHPEYQTYVSQSVVSNLST